MAKVFLTKVWGFSPEDYPALGFNDVGGRNKFLRESEAGDWVVLAGTKGPPTSPENQGRLLGKVQLGTEQIDVEAVLKSIGTHIPADQYLDGRYRWPFGLPMTHAYRFVGRPDLAEVVGDYLPGMHWASYALDVEKELGADVRQRIEALPVEPAAIIEVPEIVRQREKQVALQLNRTGPTGPGPSETRSAVERQCGPGAVYLLALRGGRRSVFKIGYCSDLGERLGSLNAGLVSAVTGFKWQPVLSQSFNTEQQAYAFEQRVHARLVARRVADESEIYETTENEIRSIWSDEFQKGQWTGSEK